MEALICKSIRENLGFQYALNHRYFSIQTLYFEEYISPTFFVGIDESTATLENTIALKERNELPRARARGVST